LKPRSASLLVVAGKGHETGQIVGPETFPFDDAEIVREIAAGQVPGRRRTGS
jgi:UDP-N-acetylmuramoyl-L-alanyl-D-glutamate--2,6-diaminopimelate ligase